MGFTISEMRKYKCNPQQVYTILQSYYKTNTLIAKHATECLALDVDALHILSNPLISVNIIIICYDFICNAVAYIDKKATL